MSMARIVSGSREAVLVSVLLLTACGSASSTPASDAPPGDTPLGAAVTTSPSAPPGSPQGAPGTPTAPGSPAPGTPTPATAAVAAMTPYRGVNLNGADFAASVLPGVEGPNYRFPTNAEVDYYLSKGMTTFRIGFLWERLQPVAKGAFDATYDGKLAALVSYATSKGAKVLLNPQNFARYYGNTVGSAQVPNDVFADFWGRLSREWASNANVMFGLVNEPNTMSTEQWVGAANAAIAAIRAGGATNVITVPGNAWTGAYSWYGNGYGTSNAVALLNIVDPGNNVVFEAHQYLDSGAGGASDQCMSPTIGSERLAPFIQWLRANNKKGIIGELAGGRNALCDTAVADMLTTVMASSDVLEGWLWWGGGPAWGSTYPFALDPNGATEAPQMAVLVPFLK